MDTITKTLNSNMLGVLLGLISGLAMNLYTGEMIKNEYLAAIIWYAITVISIIGLMYMFELFSAQFQVKAAEGTGNIKAWHSAIRDRKYWLPIYLALLLSLAVSLFFGSYNIREVNQASEQQLISQEDVSRKKEERLNSTIEKLSMQLRDQHKSIIELTTLIKEKKASSQKVIATRPR